MDPVAVAASAGLRSRMEALDMLSNNLANVTTAGYKLDREFYSVFNKDDDPGFNPSGTATLPVIQKQWIDFSQGLLQNTGNPLDVAIDGDGLFGVNGPKGTLYTRNGAFRLSSEGVLTTQEGYAVRGQGGGNIQSNGAGAVTISPSGAVQQNGATIGQLEVVTFPDTSALGKTGGSYFGVTDDKAKPTVMQGVNIEPGKLESSNVAPAESAVRLVELMRHYEMLQKAVLASSDMNKKVTEEVARVP